MSGGSFNYLCYKDADDILCDTFTWTDQFDYKMKALEDYKDFDNVEEFETFLKSALDDIASYHDLRMRLQAKLEKYHSVMKAIEWHHSGDSGDEAVKRELKDLRGGK